MAGRVGVRRCTFLTQVRGSRFTRRQAFQMMESWRSHGYSFNLTITIGLFVPPQRMAAHLVVACRFRKTFLSWDTIRDFFEARLGWVKPYTLRGLIVTITTKSKLVEYSSNWPLIDYSKRSIRPHPPALLHSLPSKTSPPLPAEWG